MRILQICNKAPYPANDGSSIAIYNLAEGLADNEVELHLLAINTKKHFKPDDQVPDSFKIKTNYQSVYKNTNTTLSGAFYNLFSPHSYFVSRFFFPEFEEALLQKLKKLNFDIVQLEGVFMASYIPLIKKHSAAKIILRSHNLEHQIWERHLSDEKNLLKKWYLNLQNKRLKKFEIDCIHNVDAVVTITDEDKKNISKINSRAQLHTCLTGIKLNEYEPVLNPGAKNTLFHFASMDWLPNIEAVDWLLDKVWPLVLKQHPGARLIIAGRGMPEHIKQQSSPQIQIIEQVASSQQFYQTYDIMLVPLWSGSGLRIKLVEGLAYGKAIITTSIGAEGIPYTHQKDVMIADNELDFATAISEILAQPELKQRLQKNARTLAEATFNYKTTASDLIQFYKHIK